MYSLVPSLWSNYIPLYPFRSRFQESNPRSFSPLARLGSCFISFHVRARERMYDGTAVVIDFLVRKKGNV